MTLNFEPFCQPLSAHNALDAQLHPDTVTPEQYADTKRSYHRTPEQRLWLAILECGIEDARNGPGVTDRAFQRWAKTRMWVEDDDDSPGSFVFCCRVLDLDEQCLRKAILDGRGNIAFVRRHTVVDSRVQPKQWRER